MSPDPITQALLAALATVPRHRTYQHTLRIDPEGRVWIAAVGGCAQNDETRHLSALLRPECAR